MRDDQWKRLKDWLPGRVGLSGAQDNRLFVDAVLLYRAGIPWRDLPVRFADFQVAHLRHSRWSHSGVWQQVFEALAQRTGNEYAMIGSTVVHKRGGAVHAAADALGHRISSHAKAGARPRRRPTCSWLKQRPKP